MSKEKKRRKNNKCEIVHMFIGEKVWEVTKHFVNATIDLAKKKYSEENVNALICITNDRQAYIMMKEVFDTPEELIKSVEKWSKSGFTCIYNIQK